MANVCFFARCCGGGVLSFSLLIITGANISFAQTQQSATELARWELVRPKIENVLKQGGYQCPSQALQAKVIAATEFHADNLRVALVNFCPASAYTEWIMAMQLKADHPIPLRSRRRDGEIRDLMLSQGSSGRHGLDVRLVPEQNAVQDIQWDADPTMHLTRCTVDVYVWNANSKRADWDARLTDQATQSYCPDLQQQLLKR